MADLTAERIARNNAAFRAANEQIRARADEAGPAGMIPFLCECAREECTTIVWVSRARYEEVRSDPHRFFSAPGHDRFDGASVEVVGREGGYVVVEKRGRAAEVVEELDRRQEDVR